MRQQIDNIRETVRQFYVTLALTGIVLIGLAILIIINPAILFALVSASFLFLGIALIYCSIKVYSLWQKLPGFIKNK